MKFGHAVIDDSCNQDSTVESDEDDVRETVVHSRLSRSGRRVESWMSHFQDNYIM